MLKRTPVLIAAFLLTATPAFAAGQTTAPTAPAAADATNGAAAAASPATGQAAAQPAAQVTPIEKKDPIVCQRQQEIGSLLHAKKVCMPKSQWDAQRQLNRENIERSQIQRGMDPVQ
ncbi:hypothetical protein WBP06_02845 [Novosphingobium sp. BL-8H]|uniref:hypothetical protein n=1 Tax=Novosphingobium sp. BL-8H TaxID=3127640 RepID=UPI0037580FDF